MYTWENLYDRLKDKAIVIIVSQSFKTFLVSSFIFFIFYNLVAKHLHSLAVQASSLDLKALEKPFVLKLNHIYQKKDEIDLLEHSYNEMRQNLHASYQTLRDEIIERERAEVKLNDYQQKLEELVSDRTIELEKEIEESKRIEDYLVSSKIEREDLGEKQSRRRRYLQLQTALCQLIS